MKYWQQILGFFLIISFFARCSQPKLDENTVAIVNGEAIPKSDLIYNLNFFPQYAPSKKGDALVKAHLNLLIDKKIFAQEGKKHGFDKTPHVDKVIAWVKRDEMLRALYAEQVRNKAQVSEEEIKVAFFQGLTSLHVHHIFVTTKQQAEQVRQALESGVPFEKIAAQTFHDSTLRANGGDLGYLTFSDMDEDFARAAFALKDGQISQPVHTKWGYHIIRVDDRRQMVFAGQHELNQMRSKIVRELKEKKEKKLAGQFVKNYMDKLDVKMVNASFNILASRIKQIVVSANQMIPDYRPMLGGKEIELMSDGLNAHLDDVLITFKTGQWTIREFIDKLRQLPMTKRPRLDNPNMLRHDIGVMLRDEFLAKEARRRGLDKDLRVQTEVKKWQEEFTFSEYWNAVRDTIKVNEAEKENYFSLHQGRYLEPEKVHVAEILLATPKEATDFLKKVKAGQDFGKLASKYSLRKWAAKNGGDLGWITRGQYGNISIKSFELKDGEVYGPVQVREGYAIIKRLGYRAIRPMNFDQARDRVTADVLNAKQDSLYNILCDELRKKSKIQINNVLVRQFGEEFKNGQIQMPGVKEER